LKARRIAMLMLTLMYLAIISGIVWVLGFLVFHATWAGLHVLLVLALVSGVAALIMRVTRRVA